MTRIDQKRLQAFLRDFRPFASTFLEPVAKVPDQALLGFLAEDLRGKLANARNRGLLLNPWSVSGLKKNEVRNCAVLATLIDSAQLGITARRFLTAILARVPNSSSRGFPVKAIEAGEYFVRCETCLAGDWSNRVDILVESTFATDGWMIAIEAKIGAGLGERQLEDYHADLVRRSAATGRKPFLLFLAPFEPRGLPEDVAKDLIHLRWTNVRVAADEAMQACTADQALARYLLGAFRDHVADFD